MATVNAVILVELQIPIISVLCPYRTEKVVGKIGQ